jgi:hypothetical protein
LLVSGESFAWSEGFDSAARLAGNSEYLFEPGLNYLNTAALGPTPRTVLGEVLKAWYELELNPVMNANCNGAVLTDVSSGPLSSLIILGVLRQFFKPSSTLTTRSAKGLVSSVQLYAHPSLCHLFNLWHE